jgi:hypothetical protein
MTSCQQPTPSRPAWAADLKPGDLVAYRFPHSEGGRDCPKVRPCVILDLEEIAGVLYLLLAYGTASFGRPNTGYAIHAGTAELRAVAGLHQPTVFLASRRILVPAAHRDFDLAERTQSPLLGRLAGDALARLHAVRARIHAEADIAAERRRERGVRRRRPAVRGVDFEVEVRRAARRPASAHGSAARPEAGL